MDIKKINPLIHKRLNLKGNRIATDIRITPEREDPGLTNHSIVCSSALVTMEKKKGDILVIR